MFAFRHPSLSNHSEQENVVATDQSANYKRPLRSVCCPKHARVPPMKLIKSTKSDQFLSSDDNNVNSRKPTDTIGHAVGPEWIRDLGLSKEGHYAVSRNVTWKPGIFISEIHSNSNESLNVLLSNDEQVDCDFVVSAIGVKPNAPFLGPEFKRCNDDDGIIVNRRLEVPVSFEIVMWELYCTWLTLLLCIFFLACVQRLLCWRCMYCGFDD